MANLAPLSHRSAFHTCSVEAFWAALVRGAKVTAASTQPLLWAVLAGAWAEDPGQPASQQNHWLELKQNKAIIRNPERPVEDYSNSNIDMPKKISLLNPCWNASSSRNGEKVSEMDDYDVTRPHNLRMPEVGSGVTSPGDGSDHHQPDSLKTHPQARGKRWSLGLQPWLVWQPSPWHGQAVTGHGPHGNTPVTWFCWPEGIMWKYLPSSWHEACQESQHHLAMFRADRLVVFNLYSPLSFCIQVPQTTLARICFLLRRMEKAEGVLLHCSGPQSWPCAKSLGELS